MNYQGITACIFSLTAKKRDNLKTQKDIW